MDDPPKASERPMTGVCELAIKPYLTIELFGYEFPAASDAEDGNWLNVEICVANEVSSLKIAHGPHLRSDELARFTRRISRLLADQLDDAELDPLEGWFNLRFRRSDRVGHCRMQFEYHSPGAGHASGHSRHSFDIPIDQTDVNQFARQIDAALRIFPVKGIQRWLGWLDR